MNTTVNLVLAVDIGGTHITAALLDLTTRKVLPESIVRAAVDAAAPTETIIAIWSGCMRNAMRDAAVAKICLALPGPFDYANGISRMNAQGKYDALYLQNVRQLLAAALQRDPSLFYMENDAASFLQGELFAGAVSEGFGNVIGLTLGTGLGTAIFNNGRAKSGDLWAFPFQEGIAEDYLSTRWFVHHYHQLTGKTVKGAREIAAVAATEAPAQEVFNIFGHHLGLFLNHFIEQQQAEAVVMGGNITKAYELFGSATEDIVKKKFPGVALKKTALGELAALYGAAGSWQQQYLYHFNDPA
ncbi:ROK family protein [Niabella beijingensis]|uniref:ROK family protein n=1 Tax=Niabella beijingensis TaxID=2872700 RepID=UPI001CBC183A|nr:ROK family protein [Niabella beijingensis]MBZ4191728.1 ROK family protein [Niabella beijingensis]